jgi:hypothetical protein
MITAANYRQYATERTKVRDQLRPTNQFLEFAKLWMMAAELSAAGLSRPLRR